MQSLLPILLIILTLIIIIKHYDNKMKTGEKIILCMIFFLMTYTCYSYMKLEGFADYKSSITKNNFMNTKKHIKKLGENDENDDNDENINTNNSIGDNFDNVQSVTADAIFSQAGMTSNDLTKYITNNTNKSSFYDIPTSTSANLNDNISEQDESKLKNIFNPSIIIGNKSGHAQTYDDNISEQDESKLKNIYNPSIIIGNKSGRVQAYGNDLTDTNPRPRALNYNKLYHNPKSRSRNINKERSINSINNGSNTGNTDSNTGNTDSNTGNTGSNTGSNASNDVNRFLYDGHDYTYESDSSQNNYKDNLGLDGKELLIFPESKNFYPGFQYVDPIRWDVPQRRKDNCLPLRETYPPSGVIETKFSYLEYNEMNKIADQENQVKDTNVGSIMPNFIYKALPYATP